MAGFKLVSTQQSLIGGYIPLNFIDIDELDTGSYEIRDAAHGSGVDRIEGISIVWLNNAYNVEAYNAFMNKYFPLQFKYADFPQNNIGSPTFRFKMGDAEKWFCYSTKKYSELHDTDYNLFIKYKWGISQFNFDDSKDYLPDTPASAENNGYMGDWWNTASTNQFYNGDLTPIQGAGFVLAKYQDKFYFGFTQFIPIDTPRFNWWSSPLYSVDDLALEVEADDFDNEQYGDESTDGGYNVGGLPSFDDTSVSIGLPADPAISVSNLGFLNTYKVTSAGLEGMLNELFPDEPLPIIPIPEGGGVLADVAYSINALASTVGNLFTSYINSNLMQYVVDVHLIPVTPETVGTEGIKIGFKTLDTMAAKVNHDYVTVDCGTLSIAEYAKNFTDYQLAKYQLYLPFVGIVPIQPDVFLGGSISVKYKFNIIEGSFTAFVFGTSSKSKLANSCIGQFSGNCCVHIPITSNSYSNIVSGLVGAVSNSVGMAEGGKMSVQQSVDEIASAANTIMSKPSYNLSNGFNATSSFMGVRVPYFIISRPASSFSANYPHEKGLPLNVTYTLSQLINSGFTQCEKPHIDGIKCSEKERQLIYNLLTGGIIL